MSGFKDLYKRRLTTPQEALRGMPRRSVVLLGFFAAQPPLLVQALADGARAGNFDEINPDVFLLQVAAMDRAGWFSFGLTGAYSLAGIERAKRLIVEVNENLPRSHGTGIVHISNVDAIVEHADKIPYDESKGSSGVDQAIAGQVNEMIAEGDTV